MPDVRPVEGSFASGEFPAVLRGRQESGEDGRLELTAGEASCSLFMSGGEVVAIAADAERFKLGSWLVARGVLEKQRAALLLLKQPDSVPLGRILIDEGILDAQRLSEELQLRAAAIVGLLLFSSGTYRWLGGERFAGAAVGMNLGTTALLLAAAHASDGDRLAELIADSSSLLQADRAAFASARDAMLKPEEAFLLSRMESRTTPESLRRLVPMPEDQLRRMLAALVVAGLAELRGGAEVAEATKVVLEEVADELVVPAREVKGEEADRERSRIVRLAVELPKRDYYRRLGLSRGATQDQVHSRYKELVALYDPERAEEPHLAQVRGEIERIHAAVVEAYQTLTSPTARVAYDEHQRRNPDATPASYHGDSRAKAARRQVVEANLQRAEELVRLGEVGGAVQLLDQAARLDPQPDMLLTLARLELKNPMWSQRALDRLKKALDIDPTNTEVWLELAGFWERRKNREKQKECLRKVLEYEPGNEEVQQTLVKLRGG